MERCLFAQHRKLIGLIIGCVFFRPSTSTTAWNVVIFIHPTTYVMLSVVYHDMIWHAAAECRKCSDVACCRLWADIGSCYYLYLLCTCNTSTCSVDVRILTVKNHFLAKCCKKWFVTVLNESCYGTLRTEWEFLQNTHARHARLFSAVFLQFFIGSNAREHRKSAAPFGLKMTFPSEEIYFFPTSSEFAVWKLLLVGFSPESKLYRKRSRKHGTDIQCGPFLEARNQRFTIRFIHRFIQRFTTLYDFLGYIWNDMDPNNERFLTNSES